MTSDAGADGAKSADKMVIDTVRGRRKAKPAA
jgi:hypothetical protein